MSLDYDAATIPLAERCPGCEGTGDEWDQVGEDPGGAPIYESVGECRSCHGTGRRPDPRYCPECGGEGEHGRGCGYVAQALADHAFDHHEGHR